MIRLSVIIPSARPEKLRICVDQLLKTVPQDTEIITVTDDPVEIEGTINIVQRGTPVSLWNLGASHSTGDYLVLGADDLWFNEGWLEASVRGMNTMGGHGLVAFNDLSPLAGNLATHYMISRGYACADWGGVLAIPAYKAQFLDNEATVRATRDGRFYYAKDAVVEHRHPFWKKADTDEIYKRSEVYYDYGERVFNERQERGFPNEWEPAFTMTDPVEDWGQVAFSSRIYKFPEPAFHWSWSTMLLAGLRTGDTMIRIDEGQPTHIAAAQIIREFLYTNKHSLLLIDDDMAFPANALETLRSNEENWKYDVVQAFCTHRTYPPHAVVMKEVEQPPLPLSLSGVRYGTLRDVDDNTVIPVDAIGLAFTLMKRHVLEALVNEYGATHTYNFIQWGHGTTGEDISFSQKLRSMGFNLAVDTTTKVEHIGKVHYGWNQFQYFANGSEK